MNIERDENNLPEDFEQLYIKAVDEETPDLWDRIEAGFEAPVKFRPRMGTIITIAAAVLVIAIMTPAFLSNSKRNKKDDSDQTTADKSNYLMMEDTAAGAEACEESYFDNSISEDYSFDLIKDELDDIGIDTSGEITANCRLVDDNSSYILEINSITTNSGIQQVNRQIPIPEEYIDYLSFFTNKSVEEMKQGFDMSVDLSQDIYNIDFNLEYDIDSDMDFENIEY